MAERKLKPEDLTIEDSTCNVFADLGLPDAEDLLAKARLTAAIKRIINERGLTQEQAGKLLGLDQPKISTIVRGRLGRFSIERLLRALNDLGQDVELTVKPAPATERRGRLLVADPPLAH